MRRIIGVILFMLIAGTASAHHRKFHQMDDFDISRGMDCNKLYVALEKLDKQIKKVGADSLRGKMLVAQYNEIYFYFCHQCEVS